MSKDSPDGAGGGGKNGSRQHPKSCANLATVVVEWENVRTVYETPVLEYEGGVAMVGCQN